MRKAFFLILVVLPVAFGQDIPRPEFPQPQFQREQWLNLNGRWEFEFDDANAGLRCRLGRGGAESYSRAITVPFCFESRERHRRHVLSSLVWYRRSFNVPADWKGKPVLLHFGAVDYRATVWVNGRLAGEHEGGNVPFRFDITPLLKPGANTVTVRAEDPPTDRYIPRGKQYWEPKSREHLLHAHQRHLADRVAGGTGANYLEKVRITPSNDGTVRFDAAQRGRAGPGVSRRGSRAGRRQAGRRRRVLNGGGTGRRPPPRSAVRGSGRPSDPNLYSVTFELRAAARSSTACSRTSDSAPSRSSAEGSL